MPIIESKGAGSAQGFGEFAQSNAVNYIENVFSTYLYTGNASSQTIANNIDVSTKGGLVWIKNRSTTASHYLFDTARGSDYTLNTNSTSSQGSGWSASGFFNPGFLTNGFGIGSDSTLNGSGSTYASWTFREQPKFFDVVTWTGNATNRTIAHSLGSVPGSIMVKRTDTTAAWAVYHRSLANTQYLVLNTTAAAATGATWWNSTTPTSAVFSLGTDASVNASGGTYVAYIFAHDAGGFGLTGTDNVISCGSFTGSASGTTVNLGWEPQWVLIKRSSGNTDNWRIYDNMRGMTASNGGQLLYADTSGSETTNSRISVNATGFGFVDDAAYGNIYIAIRRAPMKVPTDATKVFLPQSPNSGTSFPYVVTNFPVDLGIYRSNKTTAGNVTACTRLQGDLSLYTNTTGAELAGGGTFLFDSNVGWLVLSSANLASWNFQRAPSFFDVVCYTGTGSATTITHNLGVVPEMMIVKQRNSAFARVWVVYTSAVGNTKYLVLNTNVIPVTSADVWSNTTPTASVFSIGIDSYVNDSATATYVAYLFATCAGVSKVGSYTGNGTSQAIACGFTGGARFVLIKRTDATGDWYVYDTARGMTTLTDPYLLLDTNAAESATLGSVTTTTGGFTVNASILAAINTSSATYIFLAIA
jgi:hypothetical protein